MPDKKGTTPRSKFASGKLTPAVLTQFCQIYAKGGTVKQAAAKVGVHSVSIYERIRNDPEFEKRYLAARELNLDMIEDDIHTLACNGNLTAMFGVLRARRPAVWRENQTVRVEDGGFSSAFASAMQEAVTGGATPAQTDRPGQAVH